MDDERYLQRAFAAWFRSGGMDQPANTSEVRTYKRKHYVVLENVRGVMAVYRIKNDGMLRRMRRWPPAIERGD
jgi:hypothetical protein